MRIFVTGASGWIGSAVIPELQEAGHHVIGLARSDASAARIAALGAEVHRGSIDDPDSVRAGAALADGVVLLAYNHDFSRMEQAAQTEMAVTRALGDELAGSDRPLVLASGVAGLAPGRIATERDQPDPAVHPRVGPALAALAYADRGVRTVAVRFAPTVHGDGDHGFIATLVAIARDKGVAGYIGDGSNRWPAVHRFDAAHLVRLALEGAPAGSSVHAVAEEGVSTRSIAEAIGRQAGLAVVSIEPEQAAEHFGWMGRFFGTDCPASSDITREMLDWKPTQPGLLEDLERGHYFR
ncbi:MAG TPA: SDR family oxidoreductase [Micromonosporaceae bacterium]